MRQASRRPLQQILIQCELVKGATKQPAALAAIAAIERTAQELGLCLAKSA